MKKLIVAVLGTSALLTGCTFIDGHKNQADYAYTNAYEQEIRNASAEIATGEVLFFNANNLAELDALVKSVKPRNRNYPVTVIENEYETLTSNYAQLKYIVDNFQTIKNKTFYVEVLDLNQAPTRVSALKALIERNLKDNGYRVVSDEQKAFYKLTVSPLQDGIGQKTSFYVVYWKKMKKGLVHFRVSMTDTITDKVVLDYQVRGKMEAGKAYKVWKIVGPFAEDNTLFGVE
ncbi:MAG: hypothetical protein PUC11_04035 [Elusimicrobia bacterium]|nr:hypothetical protein [Elusimicrobiota bacterium]